MMKLIEIAHFTDQVEAMVSFYRALLQTDPVAESPDMAIFMNEGVKIFIHRMYTPGEGELPPESHHAYSVSDIDQTCSALADSGLEVEVPPKDYYWGRSAYLRDPDGNLIELIQAE